MVPVTRGAIVLPENLYLCDRKIKSFKKKSNRCNKRQVLPLSVVENSNLSPTRLTLLILAIRELSMPLISSREDDYGLSSVRVAAHTPLAPLSLRFGVLAGSLFSLSTQQLHPDATQSSDSSSHEPL
jgi:hypothetical protein